MVKMKKIILFLGFLLIFSFSVDALETTCSSCTDCSNKLNGDYEVVKLSLDISNYSDTCITFGADNIEFDCQGHTIDGTDQGYGVYMGGKSGNTIKNCLISEFDKGIYLLNSHNSVLYSNTVSSNDYDGIYLSNSGHNDLIDNTVSSNDCHGIYLVNSLSNTFTDNKANLNGEDGIYIHSASHHNVLSNNIANSNQGEGIYLRDSSTNTLTNNLANSNQNHGIRLRVASNNTLTNNTANWNSGNGISLYDSTNNTLTSNTANSNTGHGIYITYPSESVLNSNTVCHNTGDDFHIYNSPDNSGDGNTCDITDEWNDLGTDDCTYSCSSDTITCNSCTDCSVKLDGSYAVMKLDSDIVGHSGTCITFGANNVVFDCQGYGIDGDDSGVDYGIYLSGKSGNTVRNCRVTDFHYGINVFSSPHNVINNNIANSNVEAGIYLFYSSSNEVTSNTANSNGNNGILIYESDNNKVINNTAMSNEEGIYLSASSSNNLTGNNASNNWYGIYFLSSSSNLLEVNQVCKNSLADFYLLSGSGNLGYRNTCNTTSSWNDQETTECTYVCGECPNTKITVAGVSICNPVGVPADTSCREGWPSHEGLPVSSANEQSFACDLFEVTRSDLLVYAETAADCCKHYADTGTKKLGCHNFTNDSYIFSGLANGVSYDNFRRCIALYHVYANGPAKWYMQRYFWPEIRCSDDPATSSFLGLNCGNYWCFLNTTSDKVQCRNILNVHPGAAGLICQADVGQPNGWANDSNINQNSCIFSDLPPHVSVNIVSTGTCVDYSTVITSLLRMSGFGLGEIYSVDAPGHWYNLVKLPGDAKWTIIDTVGNSGNAYHPMNKPGWNWTYDSQVVDHCNYSLDDNVSYPALCSDDRGSVECPDSGDVYGCEDAGGGVGGASLPLKLALAATTEMSESADGITLSRSVPESANLGETIEVVIRITSNNNNSLDVMLQEFVTNAEVIDKELIYSNTSSEIEGAYPPYLGWQLVVPGNGTENLSYQVRPSKVGDYVHSTMELSDVLSGVSISLGAQKTEVKCVPNGLCEGSLGENYISCPNDCATGSSDGICDSVSDGRCDSDCLSDADPDCAAVTTTTTTTTTTSTTTSSTSSTTSTTTPTTTTTTLPGGTGTGDINGDGFVNLLDLAVLGQAYNLSEGDVNYNSNADLNLDGTVNIFDLAFLGQNWGNQY